MLGSVNLDPAGMDAELRRRWLERHPFEEDHPHIYGANFGVRASAYLAAGGFPKLASHEDRTLVQSLRNRAFTVTATDSMRVLTSGRIHARGAAWLRRLPPHAGIAPGAGGRLTRSGRGPSEPARVTFGPNRPHYPRGAPSTHEPPDLGPVWRCCA